MGITAQRLWRQKHAAGKSAVVHPPPKTTYTYVEVQEIQQAYETRLGAIEGAGGRGETRKLIAEWRERFDTWADEIRAEAKKQRDELEQKLEKATADLVLVTAERDELAELIEQSTTPPQDSEGGTAGAEPPPEAATANEAPPSHEGAVAPPTGEAAAAETTTPATQPEGSTEAGKAPRGKGSRAAR